MSAARETAFSGEVPVVVHGPLTGDPERIAAAPRAAPPAALPETASEALTAPVSVRPIPAERTSVMPGERVFGLDAFRGILLLAMNFTFTIPPWGPFPKWMYHTQVPPSPDRAYINVPGLTWQDMIFAMFVFTMAAAIPIAMGARLARGKPYPDILWSATRRAFLLLVFALVIGHVNPYWTQDYTRRGNVVAIAGLLVCFAVFLQPPPHWKESAARLLKRAGWAGVAAILFLLPVLYGTGFDPARRDHIMSALAFCTLAGTAIWLLTRRRLLLRLGIFVGIALGRAVAPLWDQFAAVWYATPAPWFYQPWYLDLLLVVIPGTVAGELITRWMRAPAEVTAPADAQGPAWSRGRLVLLGALGFSFAVILNVGLYERRYPLATAVAVAVAAGLLLFFSRSPRREREHVFQQLFLWSAVLLVCGMLVEPLEGGIRKDPQTLGFLLLMAGTAMAALGGLMVVFDSFRAATRRLEPVALVGQNALLAYVVLMLGIEHLLWLTGIGHRFTETLALATLRSVVLTALVGLLVVMATRKRIIWKA